MRDERNQDEVDHGLDEDEGGYEQDRYAGRPVAGRLVGTLEACVGVVATPSMVCDKTTLAIDQARAGG